MTPDAALVELLHALQRHGYRFTAVTPATHATVLGRSPPRRPTLRDVFGWNRPFEPADLEPELLALLEKAEAVAGHGGKLRSRVRVASLGNDLFIHWAFPTDEVDAVFFGPDTYRFVRFLQEQVPTLGVVRHIVDMGAGTGAGGIGISRSLGEARVTLVDVNPTALRYAAINAEAAGAGIELIQSDRVPGGFDILIANPPYMIDTAGRSYRDGGDLLGGEVALHWIEQGLASLGEGGTILLYTGAAYVDGASPLILALERECRSAGASFTANEIDPDVFGEELTQPAYREVERIAAIGIRIDARKSN